MLRLILLVTALAAIGCSRQAAIDIAAPAYGTDKCATCQAVIATPRHVAQIARADGTVLAFDTPGCLFRALRAESAAPGAIRFHGAGEEWIAAADAWFAAI